MSSAPTWTPWEPPAIIKTDRTWASGSVSKGPRRIPTACSQELKSVQAEAFEEELKRIRRVP